MESHISLAKQNCVYLGQAVDLIQTLSDNVYTHAQPPLYTSATGAHFRHALDHYINFLAGFERDRIDYQSRERSPMVEQDRLYAIRQFKETEQRLEELDHATEKREILVKLETGGSENGDAVWARSTLGRELDFLLSHTIHHYALISFILRHQGIDPGPEFGVAPSTLRYWQQHAPCAR